MFALIKIFHQVVDSGSFSQAAKVLHMAPSSIARNIDNLEAQLKTTLFKRSTRQLVLTEEGDYFYQQSGKLVEDTDALLAEMRGALDTPLGMLRISVFESFGNLCLAPIIPEFLQMYPDIQIELDLDNKLVDLHSENVDLAIRIGVPQDSGLKARKLLNHPTLLTASPTYLNHRSPIRQPSDLHEHNCLLISQERQRNHWFFAKGKIQQKISVKGNFISKGGSPLLTAALKDCGVLLLSEWMVKPYIDSGQLVEVLPDWTVNHWEEGSGEIFAIYKGAQYPKPHIRVFLDFLIKKLGEI
ncbi:LysR family transcriptional regulator [Shewanella psychropiezotolerans]|uniref:LysR family transcriptional regulator n=1 Tax=Shewanella psychropiezotolerans TaxID=2593655 RepID=A0ABX5X1V4_9GAMM|nr:MULTISPECIES: LysR family transcriptional regulator [Shewanella]MPY21160.1 LysR family transcriptional regulator [Shewanella sp. YLB-07]MPY21947.1 LysR family transcriptional regulator [Shewanella sp. YLB-07]QDO85171.1 LysR family transcriptional regulator [Shewanella psychropiezotolerans]